MAKNCAIDLSPAYTDVARQIVSSLMIRASLPGEVDLIFVRVFWLADAKNTASGEIGKTIGHDRSLRGLVPRYGEESENAT